MDSLYVSLLGSAWSLLAPSVQRLHGGGARARGVFGVRWGAGWIARAVAAILGMPRAGEGIRVTLSVELTPAGERWTRLFGDQRLSSAQWRRGEALVEAFGPVQCLFRLRAVDGALVFEQVGTRFGFGRLSLPLPRFLAPSVVGRAAPRRDDVHVDVRIHAPILGLLVAYDGLVTPPDAAGP